jgi:RNA polymerase sigma factor (sigma-70 family)
LLHRFATAGDQEAFAVVVRRHAGLVLGVCRRALPTVQDAEDACQATFLLLARKAGAVRWQASVANWLHATARKVAHNARLAAQRRARREAQAAVPEAVAAVDRMTGRELLAVLDEELARLPARYREPLVLVYLEGLTHDQAARQLGLPSGTVKTRVARGRCRLHAALTRRGCVPALGLLSLAVTAPAEAAPRLVDALVTAATVSPSPAAAALARSLAASRFLPTAALLLLVGALAFALGGVGQLQDPAPKPAQPAPASTPSPAVETGKEVTVNGRVVGPDEQPIAGATFALIDDENGSAVADAKSGADGRFQFRLPPAPEGRNPRQVVATAPGFGVDWAQEPRADAVFRLVPDLPITGRAIDLQGRPVAGAEVAVQDVRIGPPGAFDGLMKHWKQSAQEQEQAAQKLDRSVWNRGGLGRVFRTATAADGTFTLAGMGRDRVVTLLISGAGIADTFAAVATRAGFDPAGAPRTPLRLYPPDFTLAVSPDKPIAGTVRDGATGAPLAGVRVAGSALVDQLALGAYLFHAWPTPGTVSDAAGRFTLRGLPKAARGYVLVADPEEGTEHLHQFVTVADTAGFVPVATDFALPRGVVLAGQVTDATTGAAVPSRVFYRPLEKNDLLGAFGGYGPSDLPAPWHRGRDTKTDLAGRYRLTVLPGAGVVTVQAFVHASYQSARATPQEIADGIVDRQLGHFLTVGQGGMLNPEFMHAYKVISPPPAERALPLDFTIRPVGAKE